MTARIAVVVPTHNRLVMLQELVASLREGGMPAGTQLVVANDGSRDGTKEWLDAQEGFRAIHLPGTGPAIARNRGWQSTDADIICFTDDDCRVTDGWVEALVAPILRGEADIVQGRTTPRPDHEHQRGPWSRTLNVVKDSGWYQTCNIAYRRDVLEQHGGFEETFPSAAGEDTDLGLRAVAAGARFTFTDDALAHHAIHPSSLRGYLRQVPRWGDTVLVVKRHPAIRSKLLNGVFQRPTHRAAVALALTTVAAGFVHPVTSPAVVLGYLVTKTARSREQTSLPDRFVLECQRLLVASYETAVMARGSLRHRVLVL